MKFYKTAIAAILLTSSSVASATYLHGKLNLDDSHLTYLSKDNNVAGDLIGSGTWWPTTFSFENIYLEDGQDYFLHVLGRDLQRVITGFIGEFNLTSSTHSFANGEQNALTNTTDWVVSRVGWDGYVPATVHGNHGSDPWNRFASQALSSIDSDAKWIWHDDAHDFTDAYFSLPILADTGKVTFTDSVPVPSTIALMLLGILGVGLRKHIG